MFAVVIAMVMALAMGTSVFADNTINLDGHAYAYAVSVCADNLNITGNNITVTAETNLGHGIDINGPSAVGVVSKNNITVESPLASRLPGKPHHR